MSQETQAEFGKWRSFFWPVHAFELKKILPMLLIFFCISFNYTILRDTKDTLVVRAAGPEATLFLKLFGVVPAAIIFMLVYSKLSNILRKEVLFYVAIAPFLVFFGLFALVVFPNQDILHPHAFADYLQSHLWEGAAGAVNSIRYWTFSLFYILSELWGSAVLSLMFWGFANEIMRVKEAKRFYALLGIGANIALLVSGPTVYYFSKLNPSLPEDARWQISLNYLMAFVVLAGVVAMATYFWMNRNILTDKRFYDPGDVAKKKNKPKMGMMEGIMYVLRSPYLLNIAVLVIAYGICINMVEVTWKGQLKLYFPNYNDYNSFMGIFSTTTGFVTILVLFIGGTVIRKKGWGFAASATPIMLGITGMAFFAFVIFKESLTPYIILLGTTPLFLAVIFGMVQNFLSKSTKYALFDPTKEMAYIPLDQESKVKGKAAVDVVGARLGKSGGALLQLFLVNIFGSIAAITPYLAVLMIAMISWWLISVKKLNTRFLELTEKKDDPTAEQPAIAGEAKPVAAG